AKLKRGGTRGREARGRSGAFVKRRVKEGSRRFDEGMEPKKGIDESSLDELFLYTTVCIVGFPVEVQVKDGSLYSGILHTACFEKDQGIVLKKARKIGDGKCDTNLALGDFVDTLVILSSDLVQVAVKEFLPPADHVAQNNAEVVIASDLQTCDGDSGMVWEASTCEQISASRCLDKSEESEPLSLTNDEDHVIVNEMTDVGKFPDKALDNMHETRGARQDEISLEKVEENSFIPAISLQQRQVIGCKLEGEKHCDPAEEMAQEVHHLSPNSNANGSRLNSSAAMPVQLVLLEGKDSTSANISPSDARTSAFTATPLVSHITTSSFPVRSALSDASIPKKSKAGSITAKESKLNPSAKIFTPSVANLRPLPTAVPNIVLGHASIRQLPIRMNGQYHPLQAGHFYSNPHSQMLMVGQFSQPAYVHPVSQDAIQRMPVMPQGQPHPLLTQANGPKFQAQAMQLAAAPPIVAGGIQTIVAPPHAPFSQPFAAIQPIVVPGGNGYFFH
ncbi:Ataxin-2 C-terminal region, partial [Musa troglodytarum]